jgi:hypothetical protein
VSFLSAEFYYRIANSGGIVDAWQKTWQDLTLEECKLIFGRLYLQQSRMLESVKDEFENTYRLPVRE